METLGRIVKGCFVGAFAYAISFYCFIILGAYIVRHKLDFGGEWGGFILGAVIAFAVGGIIGGIIGLVHPKSKTTLIVSLFFGVFLMIFQAISFFSSNIYQEILKHNNYWLIFIEIFSWIIFVLILAFNNWLISKIILVKEKNVLPS
jgi:hypothetical protein